MIGLFKQKPWFEDFSDQSIAFPRRTHDDDPADSYSLVITYDRRAADRASARGLSKIVVVTVGFPLAETGEDRMPKGDVVMALRSSLDQNFAAVCEKAKVKANLLATQTGGGVRHYFLLLDSVGRLDPLIREMPLPAGLELDVWERGDLPALISWLSPDQLEEWASRDGQVRSAFAGRGDDGKAPRDTRFFFLGGEQDRLAEVARQAGFDVLTDDGGTTIIRKDMPITVDDIGAENRVFREWVNDFGVEYDGWEAELLVKN